MEDESIAMAIKEESGNETSEPDEDEPSPKRQHVTSPLLEQPASGPRTKLSKKSRTALTESVGREDTVTPPAWSGIDPEMQMYLQFQRDGMTHYHYSFKVDSQDFVHQELISLAVQFKPLLYAVVAFAAYHHTIRLPDDEADFNSFWKYYCDSITKLRKFLESNKDRDDLVLLTILQLATIEEYMGDWNSLVSHHKAAYGLLTSRYTPQTIMKTDRGRKIFDWYVRLDVIAGLMSVRDLRLDRAWLVNSYEWHEAQSKLEGPDQLRKKQEFFGKAIELVAHDVAHLFARANEAQPSFEGGQPQSFPVDRFLSEVNGISDRLDELRCQIQELHDPSLAGIDQRSPEQPKDAVFMSDVPLFRGALWPLNFIWLGWYGVQVLLENSKLATLQKAARLIHPHAETPPSQESLQQQAMNIMSDLTRYSKIQCEIFNAISTSSTAPAGVTLVCYASVGLSTIFLPRAPPEENSRYTMWARQQLADLERQGYVWPPHFRKEMANLWGIPEIEDWWLPNGEGKPRILEEIRTVVMDRTRYAQQRERPGQDQGRDLREIKGLFEVMEIGRRGSIDALATSTRPDPAYVSSPTSIFQTASMVSSPGGSTDGASGPASSRGSFSDAPTNRQRGKSRKMSRSGIVASITEPLISQPRPGPSSSCMSQIWEDHHR